MSPVADMGTDSTTFDSKAALDEAINAAGGDTALARLVSEVELPMPKITRKGSGHVGKWKARGECPPDVVLRIEAVTGVSRHRLRPDVFGLEPIDPPAETLEAAE